MGRLAALLCLDSYFQGNDGSVGGGVLGRTSGLGVAGRGKRSRLTDGMCT